MRIIKNSILFILLCFSAPISANNDEFIVRRAFLPRDGICFNIDQTWSIRTLHDKVLVYRGSECDNTKRLEKIKVGGYVVYYVDRYAFVADNVWGDPYSIEIIWVFHKDKKFNN